MVKQLQEVIRGIILLSLVCWCNGVTEAKCSKRTPKCIPPEPLGWGRHLLHSTPGSPFDSYEGPARNPASLVPPESPELQAAIVARLERLMNLESSSSSSRSSSSRLPSPHPACNAGIQTNSSDGAAESQGSSCTSGGDGGSGDGSSSSSSGSSSSGRQLLGGKKVRNENGWYWRGPRSQLVQKLTFLENDKIKVGVDLERAGAISWVSSPLMPGKWKGTNLLNNWDSGRLLQQSFYGCKDETCWYDRAWRWNPVQAGSWQNRNGQTRSYKVVEGKTIQTAGFPRNWGGQDLVDEVVMYSDISLMGRVIAVNFTMWYKGQTHHPRQTQETPAVFVLRDFSVLALYEGSKAFKDDKKLSYYFPPGNNIYAFPSERWAAYLDPDTGYGLGVFVPAARGGVTAYRMGGDKSPWPWDTSYFAHTVRMAVSPEQPVYKYQAFITVGKADEIRDAFVKLAADERILPKEWLKPIPNYFLQNSNEAGPVAGHDEQELGRLDMAGRFGIFNASMIGIVGRDGQVHHEQQQQQQQKEQLAAAAMKAAAVSVAPVAAASTTATANTSSSSSGGDSSAASEAKEEAVPGQSADDSAANGSSDTTSIVTEAPGSKTSISSTSTSSSTSSSSSSSSSSGSASKGGSSSSSSGGGGSSSSSSSSNSRHARHLTHSWGPKGSSTVTATVLAALGAAVLVAVAVAALLVLGKRNTKHSGKCIESAHASAATSHTKAGVPAAAAASVGKGAGTSATSSSTPGRSQSGAAAAGPRADGSKGPRAAACVHRGDSSKAW